MMTSLLAISALGLLLAPGQSTEVISGPCPPPVEGGGPVEVRIGFHILDFARITAREQSFDVTTYLELRWRDPRLSHGIKDSKIWTPRLNFDNAVESPKSHSEPEIEVDSEGWVTSRSIISGKFCTPLDLRKFPFDTQELAIRIALFNEESKVKFVPIPESMEMHDDAFVADWSVLKQDFSIVSRQYHQHGPAYSNLIYRVQILRRSTFYAWRVMLPLTLLSLIPFLVFWFEPTNLQPQINTCMATLIAMLTFGYSVDFALPKVAYLTLVDRHAMIGFAFATASMVSVAVIHRSICVGQLPSALKTQKIVRRLYPFAYLTASGLNFSLFLIP